MNVLKSFAHQVASYHPEKVRDELFAEIYDELCEQYGDWLELNPGKTEAEFLDDSKDHPARYATRLLADSSACLVGPQYYFSLLSALKIGVTITVGAYLALGVILALASGKYWSSFWRVAVSIPESILWVSAAILGVFIALEKSGERASWLDNWRARDLKPLESHKQISRAETLFDLAISTFALLWLAGVIQFPMVIHHDGAWVNDWVVNLPTWFWSLIAVLLVFDIGFCIVRIVKEFWSRNLRLITIATNLIWIAVFIYALSLPQLLTLQDHVAPELTQLAPLFNKVADGILMSIGIILLWDTISQLRRISKD